MEYNLGNEVEFTVTAVQHYGVFGLTDDQTTVFIHVSKVKTTFTPNLERYFKVGDKVKGEIIELQEDGKIAVSVLNYSLPDYDSILTSLKLHDELDFLYQSIEKVTGFISPSAKRKIERLVERFGLAKVSMIIGKNVDFKPDASLMLAEKIEKEVGGYL